MKIPPKHSCPNCGANRASPTGACDTCRYPLHERVKAGLEGATDSVVRPVFQFRVAAILFFMFVAAVLARVFHRYGWDGVAAVLDLCSVLSLPIEFMWRFWKNAAVVRQ